MGSGERDGVMHRKDFGLKDAKVEGSECSVVSMRGFSGCSALAEKEAEGSSNGSPSKLCAEVPSSFCCSALPNRAKTCRLWGGLPSLPTCETCL